VNSFGRVGAGGSFAKPEHRGVEIGSPVGTGVLRDPEWERQEEEEERGREKEKAGKKPYVAHVGDYVVGEIDP
jgi:hypothetical protein